jgi:hypothetical protein
LAAVAVAWARDNAACILLVRGRNSLDRMAYPGGLRAGLAVGGMARVRARFLLCDWTSFLVAGCSAMAERTKGDAMDDSLVSFSRYVTLRYPFGVSSVL